MSLFPYILSIATVAIYFGTEAKKERTYPALAVGMCFLDEPHR